MGALTLVPITCVSEHEKNTSRLSVFGPWDESVIGRFLAHLVMPLGSYSHCWLSKTNFLVMEDRCLTAAGLNKPWGFWNVKVICANKTQHICACKKQPYIPSEVLLRGSVSPFSH